ncbi:MAG: class I SAM-dependent methyltransferase [Pseudomonadota bacterium]
MPKQVVIRAGSTQQLPALEALAQRTGFELVSTEQSATADYCLFYRNQQLTLSDNTIRPRVEVAIDFCAGKNRHRQRFGGGHGQPVARAVNTGKLQQTQHIIADATGGFGRDALVFASLGCRVLLLERSPVVYELLRDALSRAQQHDAWSETAARMQVHLADSTMLPQQWPLDNLPHTVYLDPMYPQSGKSAAAKKEMQTLKGLLSCDTTASEENDRRLLGAALRTATQRVVVKRPKSAAPIQGPAPVGHIKSANTRYDIYHPQQ